MELHVQPFKYQFRNGRLASQRFLKSPDLCHLTRAILPKPRRMALKAVHVSDVPNLYHVPENAAFQSLCSSSTYAQYEEDEAKYGFKFSKFVVIGHRGSGMNMLQSSDRRMKSIKENSILSFNRAAQLPLDYIEFDVQVTKDDHPVIFHDNFILTEEQGTVVEKRVTELTLTEFLSYGPQIEDGKVGKPLFRKTKDGRIFEWKVEEDDSFCTLQETFQKVIFEHAKDRPIYFSSFQPDAALLMRKLQRKFPVFFLTNGGSEVYTDVRRNSLDEAIKLCLEGDLQGIVSEIKAILRNPGEVARIKESNLALITYGQLNNVPEVVYTQHLMGVEGVIADLVQDTVEAVSDLISFSKEGEGMRLFREDDKMQVKPRPRFSRDELSFLLELVSELIKSSS